MPCTRDDRALDHRGHLAVHRLRRSAVERVLTDTTGWSTWGSSRISMPFKAARPATMISVLTTSAKIGRRMNSAVKPAVRPALVMLGRRRSFRGLRFGDLLFLIALLRLLLPRLLVAHHTHRAAVTQALHAFHDDGIALGKLRLDQHLVRIALDDLDRNLLRLCRSIDAPDIGAVRTPLDRQRIDRRIFVAGKRTVTEKDMPARAYRRDCRSAPGPSASGLPGRCGCRWLEWHRKTPCPAARWPMRLDRLADGRSWSKTAPAPRNRRGSASGRRRRRSASRS